MSNGEAPKGSSADVWLDMLPAITAAETEQEKSGWRAVLILGPLIGLLDTPAQDRHKDNQAWQRAVQARLTAQQQLRDHMQQNPQSTPLESVKEGLGFLADEYDLAVEDYPTLGVERMVIEQLQLWSATVEEFDEGLAHMALREAGYFEDPQM